jgi:DNA polymerase IV
LVLQADQVRQWMAPLPIRRLWGVGPVTAERLQSGGFAKIGEVADAPLTQLTSLLGRRAAEFQARAQGIDEAPVCSDREAKSIGEENTFETDIAHLDPISAAITAHSETVAHRLRLAGLRARTISLKIKLARKQGTRAGRTAKDAEPVYPVLSRGKTVTDATDDAATIRAIALQLWETAEVTEPIRLLGVTASNLSAATEAQQLGLFEQSRRSPVGKAMDAIVERFGKGAIRRAVDEPIKITPSLHRRPDK